MAVLPKVRSALCVASQLPGEGPLMWKMLLHQHVNQNPMIMMKDHGVLNGVLTLKGKL